MKIVKREKLICIDKDEIDEFILAKRFIGLNKSPRDEKIIVSLTSYKPRINDVKYTIYSLLNQTFPPDELILWLDEDSFPQREENLPQDLLELQKFGLTIDWCENLYSYKKLIPVLEKYPEDIIVTADDDIFYRADWLKILCEEHAKNPDCVIAHRGHRLRLDTQGKPLPYLSWHFEITPFRAESAKRYSNFFTGSGGVLYSKKFFHDDIFRQDLFTKISPLSDDIWFWAMSVLHNTKIKIPTAAQCRLIYVDFDTQRNGETLWSKNKIQNDTQLQQVLKLYPELLEKLIREDAESEPYLSVVMLLKDFTNFPDCLKNISKQKFPDFEVVLINCSSCIELQSLPTNFHVINYPGGSVVDALNLGLRKAEGDYVLFAGENVIFPYGGLDIAAQTIDMSNADVIHFAGHIQLEGDNGQFVLDDTPELKSDTPTLFDAPKQLRAVFWLQNKLSNRLDTKIFRRDFLLKHGITFGNDLTEFLFQALTQADKYLIAPQAFCFCK